MTRNVPRIAVQTEMTSEPDIARSEYRHVRNARERNPTPARTRASAPKRLRSRVHRRPEVRKFRSERTGHRAQRVSPREERQGEESDAREDSSERAETTSIEGPSEARGEEVQIGTNRTSRAASIAT